MGKTITEINGIRVKDAKKPLILIISEEDVKRADVKAPKSCAAANACRHIPDVKEARVHLTRVYLRKNDREWVRYLTPPKLRTEIVAFDRGGRFAPGEYTLGKPSRKLGTPSQNVPAKKKKQKKRHPVKWITDVRSNPA